MRGEILEVGGERREVGGEKGLFTTEPLMTQRGKTEERNPETGEKRAES